MPLIRSALKLTLLSILVALAIYLVLINTPSNRLPDSINIMLAKDGSYAFSGGAGLDRSTMSPFRETACDNSLNGRESVSVAHNGTRQKTWYVRDGNGYGNGCATGSMPFRGKYHYACEAYPPVNCGRWSTH